MEFPTPFMPDLSTRAGRMLAGGRVKVTVSAPSAPHITVLFKCFADNRKRQYDDTRSKNWIECPFADASHIFVEVPSATRLGNYNDSIGTFYPKSNKWYEGDNADPVRVDAAIAIANFLMGDTSRFPLLQFKEANECGKCGLELTDPVSIERGFGPDCFGKVTGSVHQVKGTEVAELTHRDRREPRSDMQAAERASTNGDWIKDLGIASGAENALYSLAEGMNEAQLETLQEWTQMRLDKVREARGTFAKAETRKEVDRSFMGR